jgi:predicted nucleotidyltransferase component of viral defense system
MIPISIINEWRQIAPWSNDSMVEQDLILSRLLAEFFNHPEFNKSFAFRGGTAIYKLFSSKPVRYSEDIDLVQINAEPIGNSLNIIRSIVDPLLGIPKRKASSKGATLTYSFLSETQNEKQSIKIEINTREHFSVFGWEEKKFEMQSKWYSGNTLFEIDHQLIRFTIIFLISGHSS